MIKEQFIRRMQLIQNFHSEQETLGVLIDKITDGYPVVTIGGYLIDEIINMINEDLHIKDEELLYWWLHEDVDKVIYDKDKTISARTLEELYDYIVNTYAIKDNIKIFFVHKKHPNIQISLKDIRENPNKALLYTYYTGYEPEDRCQFCCIYKNIPISKDFKIICE